MNPGFDGITGAEFNVIRSGESKRSGVATTYADGDGLAGCTGQFFGGYET